MSTGLRLGEYAVTPLYNIKAVVQATGISPSTLRAWERRYDIARPERSNSGYRLYAERDVAIIRWLKAQVDAGMAISQAVSWLGTIVNDAGKMEKAVLPVVGSGTPLQTSIINNGIINHAASNASTHSQQVRDYYILQQELIRALVNYDETGAEALIAEAFSMYTVEQVGDRLFMPVLHKIVERRVQGDLSMTTERFAANYLLQRLGTMLRFIPSSTGGPLIWVICACTEPGKEVHEASALLLAIYLRRSGYQVHYLGRHLATDEPAIRDFANEAMHHQPAMTLFCVSTIQAAEMLAHLTSRLTQMGHDRNIIGYSGPIFNHNPDLRATIAATHMGASAKEVTQNLDQLLKKGTPLVSGNLS